MVPERNCEDRFSIVPNSSSIYLPFRFHLYTGNIYVCILAVSRKKKKKKGFGTLLVSISNQMLKLRDLKLDYGDFCLVERNSKNGKGRLYLQVCMLDKVKMNTPITEEVYIYIYIYIIYT